MFIEAKGGRATSESISDGEANGSLSIWSYSQANEMYKALVAVLR